MADVPLRVLIVDDEAPARRRLRELLDDCAAALPLAVVGEAQNGREAVELLQSVPVELMFRYTFLPYRVEAGRLVLVMADPTDIPVVDELSLLLRRPVQPAVGTPSAIQEALKRGQGTQRVLEQASESFKIQVLHGDENGEEILSIDKIQSDASPIIRLVDSAVFDALNRRASDIHIETRDTEVVITHELLPESMAGAHIQGWTAILELLSARAK